MPEISNSAGQLTRNPDFVYRSIGQECLLVKVTRHAAEHQFLYSFNEVGGFIWERLDGETSTEDLREAIVTAFEVSPEEAESDLREFIDELQSIDAVRMA